MITGEHEFEPVHGLPEALPAGERLLWQGAPSAALLAREALHWRKLALYFGLLLAWRAASVAHDGGGPLQVLQAVAWVLPLPLLALGIVFAWARLLARTTVYTVTDRRVVMRVGIVLSLSFNLPYRQIAAAAVRQSDDGSGDIVLSLAPGNRIAWLHLWPHARPWQLRQPQPMLRGLPQVAPVARLLREAWLAGAAPAAVAAPNKAGASVPPATVPARPTLQPEARAA
ncbi:photosynthetic complex putative assembly protein PuhB [Aquabacterium sp.]|uniref:photosynthetic complex putative assembly protein PuhB n=1 Tax=Aquabacterium sp. TaxID=1872578 RepID=UPI00378396A2